MPVEGDVAPDFKLMGDDKKIHKLADFKGKYLVLYFYPRDNTAGCTIEAKEFTSMISDFRKAGAEIAGVSDDSVDSHCDFRDKQGLKVLLLADPGAKVIKAYDSWGNKGVFGQGTIRNTFLIGKDGKILKAFMRVNPLGHADSVLSFIKQL